MIAASHHFHNEASPRSPHANGVSRDLIHNRDRRLSRVAFFVITLLRGSQEVKIILRAIGRGCDPIETEKG
jgi:hypothetical protein